jgi:hypothetical protein
MPNARISVGMKHLVLGIAVAVAVGPGQAQQRAAPAATLDFEYFRTRVEPIFLHKRPALARCYVCHSQGTPLRLQPLSPGNTTWTVDESRKNYEAVQRVVIPGNPDASPLLLMPLASDAGSKLFHPGGKHWTSRDDPEWRVIAEWVRGAK